MTVIKKDKNLTALTPPMGWNSWDCYAAAVNEKQLLNNAEYMAKNLKKYGWQYVICDIQWYEPLAGTGKSDYIPFAKLNMDEYSRLIPAENRFPSAKNGVGFKAIADKIHLMGLKFGIHIMRGIPRQAVHSHSKIKGTAVTADKVALENSICKWNTDMYGVNYKAEGAQEYYDSIFSMYAEWGIDFVKVDDICNTNAYPNNPYSAEKEIEMIRKAIDKTDRSIVLSLSPGPAVIEKSWHLKKFANMWRITDDFWDNWKSLKNMFERCEVWSSHVEAGCFPDCDMLPLGHLGIVTHGDRYTNFTKEEQLTMMTLWCIFRSPLMIGSELTDLDEWTLSLLTNDEVLYLLKYTHGAKQIERDENHAVWESFDDDGNSEYLALFNLSDEKRSVEAELCYLNIESKCFLRDLWKKKDLGTAENKISAEIDPHGAVLYKLS